MTPEQFSTYLHLVHLRGPEPSVEAIDEFEEEFPELKDHRALICKIIKAEEIRMHHQYNARQAADRVDQIEAELRLAVLGEAK
jgi:plasmid stabilization system protein ParE